MPSKMPLIIGILLMVIGFAYIVVTLTTAPYAQIPTVPNQISYPAWAEKQYQETLMFDGITRGVGLIIVGVVVLRIKKL